MPENTYTTYEIARFCDVYPSSVIHWINAGRLRAYLTPGGHHRVTREDLLDFFERFQIPVPPEVSQGAKRLLIVDDDVELARALQKAFERQEPSLELEVCHTGVDALISIGARAPGLVILDIVLPKMDGAQVCSILKAKAETRGIKIVGISGKRAPNEAALARYELDAFFRKPLDVLELVAKSMELLGVRTPAPKRG